MAKKNPSTNQDTKENGKTEFVINNNEVQQMEAAFTALLPTLGGPAIAILIVIFMYLKITSARKETKAERDKDSEAIHDKILTHDFEISRLNGEFTQQRNLNADLSNQINILSQSVAKFSVAVDMLSESVKEIREEIRNDKCKKC